MNDKFRQAIKLGIIDEDYKDYLAVEKIPHDFSEKYEQRIGELIKTNRKSGHRHIKITLRFAAAINSCGACGRLCYSCRRTAAA